MAGTMVVEPEPVLAALATDLAAADSGVGFVYRALERLSTEKGWSDAVLILEDPRLGRQVFRSGRRPPAESSMMQELHESPAGLYVRPGSLDVQLNEAVTKLCSVAVAMDLLRHDASHDALTGLFNRRSFDQLLSQAAARSQRYGWSFALAILDLDHFKDINDRLGHDGGDAVLRAIGGELRQSLRAGDVAARVGGDEFALILANGDEELVDSIVHRLEQAVAPLTAAVEMGFSVGVAVAPREAEDLTELYRLADSRLYEAKRR